MIRFCTHIFQEVLWDLGGLFRACLTLNDQDLVLVDGSQQVLSVGKDGQASSDLLHGLFVQLSLGQSRDLLILNTTGSQTKATSGHWHYFLLDCPFHTGMQCGRTSRIFQFYDTILPKEYCQTRNSPT